MAWDVVSLTLPTTWTAFAAYGQSYYRESWLRMLGSALNMFGGFTATGQQYSRTFTKQSGEAGVRRRMAMGPIHHSLAMVATGYWT